MRIDNTTNNQCLWDRYNGVKGGRHNKHSMAMECLLLIYFIETWQTSGFHCHGMSCIYILYCVIIYMYRKYSWLWYLTAGLPKAVAWARPGQSQAMIGGFGSAQDFSRPKPPQAKPKLGLLGQAGDRTEKCICTDIAILAYYFCKFNLFALLNEITSWYLIKDWSRNKIPTAVNTSQ